MLTVQAFGFMILMFNLKRQAIARLKARFGDREEDDMVLYRCIYLLINKHWYSNMCILSTGFNFNGLLLFIICRFFRSNQYDYDRTNAALEKTMVRGFALMDWGP